MATIYDVAKEAGVSPKTISRVINNSGAVSARTRASVKAAISRQGYVPSLAARSMRSNRSGLVGMITGAISSTPSHPDRSGLPDLLIVQGIQTAMEDSGKTLLIADTGGQRDRVCALMDTFAQHRIEGLIYVAPFHQKVALSTAPARYPVVIANGYDAAGTPCIVPCDEQGQHALVSRILASGHERIAYLTFSERLDAARLRTEGYRRALAEADVAYDPDLVIATQVPTLNLDASAQMLWDAIDRLLSLPTPPSALCLGNDAMAMGAYEILRSRGLQVPQDISVAGFDNHRIIAERLYPSLTTVELPYTAIGIRAAQMLMDLIHGKEVPCSEPTRVVGSLAWRDSIAAASSGTRSEAGRDRHRLTAVT